METPSQRAPGCPWRRTGGVQIGGSLSPVQAAPPSSTLKRGSHWRTLTRSSSRTFPVRHLKNHRSQVKAAWRTPHLRLLLRLLHLLTWTRELQGGVCVAVGSFCKQNIRTIFCGLIIVDTFLVSSSRSSPLPLSPSPPPSSLHSTLGTSPPSDVKPQPPSVTSEATPTLALEYQPLPRREKTCEDLRVEALARQLVRGRSQRMMRLLSSCLLEMTALRQGWAN